MGASNGPTRPDDQNGARTVTAIDVSTNSLGVTRKLADGWETSAHGTLLDLPFKAESFDAVTMFEYLSTEARTSGTQLVEGSTARCGVGSPSLSSPHRHWLASTRNAAF